MRVALGLEYVGEHFSGWQTQANRATVQDALERALAAIAGEPVATICAGRTDSGVHATSQVVHFDFAGQRPLTAWVRGVNSHLPAGVSVQWAAEVPDSFHARFSAQARRYRYVLYNAAIRPALLQGRVGWYHWPLDEDRMQAAARMLLGTHDFSSFRAAECQANSPVRVMYDIQVQRQGNFIFFDFYANAFLHHMIRNIVGVLVYIGQGKDPVSWMVELLALKDRKRAAPTFMPDGLYLCGVDYPGVIELPQQGLLQRLPVLIG